jgi:Flp pilus assembly protein TadG
MALVLPLLMLIICGIIDFGRMFNAQITLTQAAREGARAAAYGQTSAQITTRVRTAGGDLPGLTVDTPTTCPNAGGAATVTARVTFEFVTPFAVFAEMFGTAPDGSFPLTSTGVVTCSS